MGLDSADFTQNSTADSTLDSPAGAEISLKPRRCSGVRQYELPDGLLLFKPQSLEAFALNASASAVWDLCDGEHTIANIASELSQCTGRTPEELLSDIVTAVQKLLELGLVEQDAPF
ncbi:MAG: PqqD family protein [Armatimonadota bacterium]